MAGSRARFWPWLVVMAACLAWAGTCRGGEEADPLGALVAVLAEVQDAQARIDILKGIREGLKGQRTVTMPSGWEVLAAKLAKDDNLEVRDLARSISLTFGSPAAFRELRGVLQDPNGPTEARKSALEALLGAKDPQLPVILRQLLAEPALRSSSLRALAAYEDPEAPAAILRVYPGLKPEERRDALNTLVARQVYARALVEALEKGIVGRSDLSADIVRQLRNLRQPELTGRLEKVWGKSRESGADKLKEIARYKAMVLSASGGAPDRGRGRGVFAHTCQQCHTLFGVGGKVGPDLTGSNRADLDYLLENIVDPNAVIPIDYRTWVLETKDDRVISGIMRRQDDQAVTLVTPNELVTVPRGEIRSLEQSELSMMPEGILTGLGDRAVRDLAAYLRGGGQVEAK